MVRILGFLVQVSWFLGLLSMVAAVVVKLLQLEVKVNVTSHTLFLVAGTFFLCSLATREMQRNP
jgi:hypothetical protein